MLVQIRQVVSVIDHGVVLMKDQDNAAVASAIGTDEATAKDVAEAATSQRRKEPRPKKAHKDHAEDAETDEIDTPARKRRDKALEVEQLYALMSPHVKLQGRSTSLFIPLENGQTLPCNLTSVKGEGGRARVWVFSKYQETYGCTPLVETYKAACIKLQAELMVKPESTPAHTSGNAKQQTQGVSAGSREFSSDHLVYLTDDVYSNRDRTQLFLAEEGEEGDKTFKPIKTRWGMPILVKVYQEDARDDEHIDNHTFYEIHLSKRAQQGVKRFSHYQIEHGKWAAAFGGVSIAKQTQQKFYANIIFEQMSAFDIPLEIMPEHTGFQIIDGTEEYRYVLRTGEHLHADGTITGEHAPLARYSFDNESHTKHLTDWRHYEQALPLATKELAADLFAWAMRIDPSGNLLLLLLFSYRSLLCTLAPIETAIIAAAEDGTTITDGGSGSGKTSSIDFSRGVDGPTPFKAEQDAGFNGSLTGIETRINPLRDLLVSISDFHFNTENPSDSEIRAMADKFDAFIRSVSDNGEVKSRGRRNLTSAQGTRIKAGLVFDGEMLPPLFLSRLRRAIFLQFKRGVLNGQEIHSGWWEYQGKHTAIGRAIIASVLTALNADRSTFIQQFKEVEAKKCAELFEALITARPSFDKAIARSLANNYARCLSPLLLLKNALGFEDSDIEGQAKQAALSSLTAFATMIDNGGPSQITAEWMISTINAIFEEGQGYPLDMKNFPLDGEENSLLNRWGYERTGLTERLWAPPRHGVHLANLSDDWETLWLRNEQLLNAVKKRALKDFPTFPYSIQTFPAFLVRLGIAERNEKQNTWLERFGEKGEHRDRRLKVQISRLTIEVEEERAPDPPPPNSDTPPRQDEQPQSTEEESSQEGANDEPDTSPAGDEPDSYQAPNDNVQDAARAFLDELAGMGCTLSILEDGMFNLASPEAMSEDIRQELKQRTMDLAEPLISILSGPAQSVNSSHQDEPPVPHAQPTKQGKKERAYVDVIQGCGITESGKMIDVPAGCTLAELARAVEQIGNIERVFLCGTLPDVYEEWLLDTALYQNYASEGCYFDPKDPSAHVVRFKHRVTGNKLVIRSMSVWMGDSEYTVEQAREAVALLTQYLQGSFTHDTSVYSTPAQTFQQIWTRQNRIDKKAYPLLPQEIRNIIRSTSGQGRVELCTQEDIKKLPGLHYYDGVFMYAALARGSMPTEVETHDNENVYAGYTPARYRIRYTVPTDWQHIGLFMTPRTQVTGHVDEAWYYPAEKEQGRTFETWVDGAEIDVLRTVYGDVETGMKAWDITILERIVFKQEKDSANKKPLGSITNKIIKMREQVEQDARLDTSRTVVFKLVRGMARNIELHGIGVFHRNKRALTVIQRKGEPAPDVILAAPQALGDDLTIYSVPGKVDAYSEQFDHPEWTASIWARCRARMAKWALSLPREAIIAIRTDAIATTQEVADWKASEKVGTLREKWTIRKPLKAPHTYEELDMLVEKHVKEGK